MLFRYSEGINYILNKDYKEGHKLILKAIEKDRDEKLYQWWVALVPNMNKKTFISFNTFRDSMTGQNIDKRSADEIVAEGIEIEKRLKNGS